MLIALTSPQLQDPLAKLSYLLQTIAISLATLEVLGLDQPAVER